MIFEDHLFYTYFIYLQKTIENKENNLLFECVVINYWDHKFEIKIYKKKMIST